MQEERQLSWSLQTREPATSLSGTRDLLDGLFCESVHLMTILNIAKILMNMKSSWFSDLQPHIVTNWPWTSHFQTFQRQFSATPWSLASTGTPGRSPRRCPRRRFRRGPRSSLSWRYVPQKLDFWKWWYLTKIAKILRKMSPIPGFWSLPENCPFFEQTVHTWLIWIFISSRWSTTTTWCPLGTPLTSASTRQTWTRSCWRWFSFDTLNDVLHCVPCYRACL